MKANQLDNLFLQAPVAICIVNGPNYVVELVNERMLQFLGRTAAIVGHPLQQTLTQVKEQGLIAILDKVRQSKQPYYFSNFPAVILIDGIKQSRYFDLIFKPYFSSPGDEEPTGIFCVAHNVTEAVLSHQKLQEEKEHTALALETGELGIMSTNWSTNAITADKRANEIFDLKENALLDDYVTRIHPDDRAIRQQAFNEGTVTGHFDFEVRLILSNGQVRWVRSRGMMQKNEIREATGTFAVVQDITAQKQFALELHRQVEQHTAELLRSNANLEEFARAASHDLKEPVRKIQVFASRLKELLTTRLTKDETAVFERMENAADRMGLLVDDLLEYSHLNHPAWQPEKIDLNEKLTKILSDLELVISDKAATIKIGQLPTVKGHRRQLQQLFQNLLTNALKYSQPQTAPYISITASVVKGEELTNILPSINNSLFHSIKVQDNGIGFHESESEKIFELFTRLHGRMEYHGTGIGLSIAKKVVDNHKGYIYANGEQGKGACFTVLLPVDEETT